MPVIDQVCDLYVFDVCDCFLHYSDYPFCLSSISFTDCPFCISQRSCILGTSQWRLVANSPLETHEEKQSKWSQEFKSFVVLSRSIHWIEPISEIVLQCAFSEQFSTEKSSNIEWSDSTFTAQVTGLNMFLELSAH